MSSYSSADDDAKRLTRGSWHEIFVLSFEEIAAVSYESLLRSEYSCVARFARVKGHSAKEESEIATIRYLKQHTSIPVPEIYYQDLDPENEIGAAFVLMERLPGRHLYKTWDELSFDHKKVALSEIASVIVQFASLQFDEIGCLTESGIGPILSPCTMSPRGPFHSTLDYLQSFVSPDSVQSSELADLFQKIQKELAAFTEQGTAACLLPPFTMIHADFDA